MTRVGPRTAATRHQNRVAAHRVADQDRGLTRDFGEELVDQLRVGADGGGAPEERGLAEAREVEGERSMALRDLRPDRHPVQGAAAKAVDHDHGPSGAAEVYVMDPAVEIGDFMPHCVMKCYARIPTARRISTSATAPGKRRPSLCNRSNTANEARAPITSSASLREQPGRRASAAASRSASL